MLEAARETLAFVQGEMAHAYAIHPQPPARNQEGGALERVVSLWKAVARSYARIADADAREGTLEDQRALLAQRRVFYEGLVLVEYYRAHLELPQGLWRAVHVAYNDAVRNGLAQVRVTDPLNDPPPTDPPTTNATPTAVPGPTNPPLLPGPPAAPPALTPPPSGAQP